jgi:protein-arginine kinase activator protein McsA
MARGRRAAHALKERMKHYKEQYKKKLLKKSSLRYCRNCAFGFHTHERSTCPNCRATYVHSLPLKPANIKSGSCWWCATKDAEFTFPLNCNSGKVKTPLCYSCLKCIKEENNWGDEILKFLELIVK